MDISPGTVLDRYTIIKQLTSSEIVNVYLASDNSVPDRKVVIKVSKNSGPLKSSEALALGRLDHECVVRLLDTGSSEGVEYLVFESLPGSTLREMFDRSGGRLDLNEALPIFIDILEGLDHIHRNRVVHRDIKPDKVFVLPDGRARIIGFTIAIVLPLSGSLSEPGEGEGFTAGSPYYMPPEQWEGTREVDARSDLYAFGVLLYETLTGKKPFAGSNLNDLIQAHRFQQPPSLIEASPDLPEALESIYLRLLAKDKRDRFSNAREVAKALKQAASDQVIAAGVPSTAPLESAPEPESGEQAAGVESGIECPACGFVNDTAWKFCQNCGSKIEVYEIAPSPLSNVAPTLNICANCGTRNLPLSEYCDECGMKLKPPPMSLSLPGPPVDTFLVDYDREPGREQSATDKDWADINTAAVFGDKPSPRDPTASEFPSLMTGGPQQQPSLAMPDSYCSIIELGPPIRAKSADQASVPVFSVGALLDGRYRVEEYIARGGFANIYLVTDTGGYLNEELAVKVPIPDEDPNEMVRKLRSQLKVWKLLSDTEPQHVVRLLKVERIKTRTHEAVGIFMEYLPGGNLLKMVTDRWGGCPRNREQLAHLMRLFLQAASGVRSLHAHGFIHRDLKPVNLLLDASESVCKLADFELLMPIKQGSSGPGPITGTPRYMAPESFDGHYTIASDIFGLGATLYHLLSGREPFGPEHPMLRKPPADPTEHNPIIPPELSQIVLRCLEGRPEYRPPSVEDLIEDLVRLGLTDEEANIAPLNLARLLLTHLEEEDLSYLVQSLEKSGFRSIRAHTHQQRADLIEEYCYTAPPNEVLAQNCTGRQLAVLAGAVGVDDSEASSREEIISAILEAVGFLPGPRQVPGIESTLGYLQDQLMELANATTSDECLGMIHSGLAAVERTVGLLARFYGQLVYGSGVGAFLSRCANGKPADRMTLGEKVLALRTLCLKQPEFPLTDRVREAFKWPIITRHVFDRLNSLVKDRNRLAHMSDTGGFHWAQRFGRKVLSTAVEVLRELAENQYAPRVVQIVSRQDDIYGRHFYLGKDDRGHHERIFTPLPMEVGQLYLFYPLTNPARINPLIFRYELTRPKGHES